MLNRPQPQSILSLYSDFGERKYISSSERLAFLDALPVLDDPKERSFCEMIFWTGCRPSEALSLTAMNIDLVESVVVIRSLKKRGKLKGRHFRPVPVPQEFLSELDKTHGIATAQRDLENATERLWSFCRTTAWRRLKTVMEAAGIDGIRATGRDCVTPTAFMPPSALFPAHG